MQITIVTEKVRADEVVMPVMSDGVVVAEVNVAISLLAHGVL